ncbi:hypothetical protein LY13_003781 [Prauserella aidingensis]|nr:hypothetical protein [Prauserella aidingensis]
MPVLRFPGTVLRSQGTVLRFTGTVLRIPEPVLRFQGTVLRRIRRGDTSPPPHAAPGRSRSTGPAERPGDLDAVDRHTVIASETSRTRVPGESDQ